MVRWQILVVAALACLSIASAVCAGPSLVYEFGGVYRGLNSSHLEGSDIATSSTFSLRVVTDASAPAAYTNSEGTHAQYGWSSWDLTCYNASGGSVYNATASAVTGGSLYSNCIMVANGFSTNPFDSFAMSAVSSDLVGDDQNGYELNDVWLHLADPSATVFDGLSLPNPLPDLSEWGSYGVDNHVIISFTNSPNNTTANFEITNYSVQETPELPSSALLLLGGLPVGLAWWRRSRS